MLDEAIFTAGDLMTRHVAVVRPETSLLDAVKLMADRRVSGLPVVDAAGTVVGMLTEGDLMRWHEGYTDRERWWLDMLAEGTDLAPEFLAGVRERHRRVDSVMGKGAVTVTEDMPARDLAHLMHEKAIKRVPVLRDGALVGIVSRADLVRGLAQRLSAEQSEARSHRPRSVDESLRLGRKAPKG
jgi:CBS domain-containing protein